MSPSHLLLLLAMFGFCSSLNLRPIIGIIAQTVNSTEYDHSYLAASYVKYIESAGARVVPIIDSSSQDELKNLFESINGVVFPGGGRSLESSNYLEAGKIIFELAKEANDKGDYFPLWGTCLGIQLLYIIQTGDHKDIRTPFDAEDYSVPVNFTAAANDSRLFSMYTSEAINWLMNEPITMHNHKYGISPDLFRNTPSLNQFYKILSTNFDREGKEFVSTIEAFKYPFYGIQWHPEKALFEWNTEEHIPHTFHAISIAQTIANFFVQEARKSNHSFASQLEEKEALIYNFTPLYSGQNGSLIKAGFEQAYMFPTNVTNLTTLS